MTRENCRALLDHGILQAYANGEIVEYRRSPFFIWSVDVEPDFASSVEKYRIQPKPRYRPYDEGDVEELRALVGTKVRSRERKSVFLVTGYEGNFISMLTINYVNFSPKEIFHDYEHLDGTPIGRKQ